MRLKSTSYNPVLIEAKWRDVWEKSKTFQVDLESAKKPYFNLMMFPYPSAEGLHVGNMYAFTGSDIWGRFIRMKGFSVFEPIGLDGFGIHSENYAIKVGKHPVKQAKISEANFYRQLKLIGNQFSWDNKVETYDPAYYKWTQWIFVKLFKAGLAYRAKAAVNWCPSCKTVLADEQVIDGACERCESLVEPKQLEQWFFKITKYADRLLKNTEKIDWSEKVLIAQRNWIGKSQGLIEKWQVVGMDLVLETFTTWPHTTFGATFMVVAPEHPVIDKLVGGTKYQAGAKTFVKQVLKDKALDPKSVDKEKKGYFTGRYVINHLVGHKMPIYIANFAVMAYGTGMVKCTPAHDQRDFDFAKKYHLPMILVVEPKGKKLDVNKMTQAYTGSGVMTKNTGKFAGMSDDQAREAVAKYSISLGHARKEVEYHLRDWLISRQRYWGPPIPMINCPKCGWQPVDEQDLPVLLPKEVKDWQPKGTGRGPLAQVKDWVKTKCPKCGGEAERETDVSDTFLDSAWYFLRYPSVGNNQAAWDKSLTKKWLPVDMYIGGAEHSVLHLLYSRFLTMMFKDLGYLDFDEPYQKFRAHGLIIKDGAKMSKSKGNIVNPDQYIKKYGADALRCYLMFVGPLSAGGDFCDTAMVGMFKFLSRVYKLYLKGSIDLIDQLGRKEAYWLNKTIKRVEDGIKRFKYNTSIAALMELVNFLKQEKKASQKTLNTLILLLAPFAPFLAEELWQMVGGEKSVHFQSWPKFDPKLVYQEKIELVVQINGKLRDKLKLAVDKAKDKDEVFKLVLKSTKVQEHLKGKKLKNKIFVPGKLVNLVV